MTIKLSTRASVLYLLLSLFSFAFFLSGCGGGTPPTPDLLSLDEHASGNNQAAPQRATLAKPFRVVVEGPVERGLLGGKGSRRSVPTATVRFIVENPGTGAVFADTGGPSIEVMTDAGGTASAVLRLGDWSGDVWVNAALPAYPNVKPVRMRAIAGVEILGRDLECATGGVVDEIGVRLQQPDGDPVPGVEVYFRAEGITEGASVKQERVITGANGIAVTSWKLGNKVRRYFASAEIRDTRENVSSKERFDVRAIEFEAMATNKPNMLVVLVGGLAVFIFGMKLMSEGLQRMADRRLRSALHFMTQNRFMAVGAGTLITAIIQSSSATTVMTVGFVNAGMMTLEQAIGVVFGANIGTTVTAQIIAFRLDALAYPAIAVGLVMSALAKRAQFKALGEGILGFGLLFLGMTTMSNILEPLRHSPQFISWFSLFDCTPVNGRIMPPLAAFMCIIIGTATTCIVQSSSATVGLVLALCSQGLISFYTAVPLILGDNIGTTITANLAAIGANRNARRAALAHTLFNVFGTLYMYFLFFLPLWGGHPLFLGFVDWITPGQVFSSHPENLLRHAANAHSAFNLFNVLLFLPFTNLLATVCQTLIPMTEADRTTVLKYLEPKLLQSPAIALTQAVKEVEYMVLQGQKSVNETCDLFCERETRLIPKIIERENLIDRLQTEITAYLVQLSQTTLDPAESALIPALIHTVNDAERLGDHAESLVELYQLLVEHDHKISKKALKGLREFQEELNHEFQAIYEILASRDGSGLPKAIEIDKTLKAKVKELTDLHIVRLDAGKCDVQAGVIFLDALAHLERVGDHLVNIAERAATVVQVTRL